MHLELSDEVLNENKCVIIISGILSSVRGMSCVAGRGARTRDARYVECCVIRPQRLCKIRVPVVLSIA